MNVSEANAYQSLLRWLSDIEASDAADDRAVTDLVWLAGRAHDTLGAGHTVVTASEEVAPKVMEYRSQARSAARLQQIGWSVTTARVAPTGGTNAWALMQMQEVDG